MGPWGGDAFEDMGAQAVPGGQVGPKEEALLLALGRARWGVSKAMELWTFDLRARGSCGHSCTSVSWEEFWESGRQHLEAVKLE